MRLRDKELAFESSPGALPEWQRRGPFQVTADGSAAASRLWYARPAAAGFGHHRRQLRAYEEGIAGQETMVGEELFEGADG